MTASSRDGRRSIHRSCPRHPARVADCVIDCCIHLRRRSLERQHQPRSDLRRGSRHAAQNRQLAIQSSIQRRSRARIAAARPSRSTCRPSVQQCRRALRPARMKRDEDSQSTESDLRRISDRIF